jgi:predicted phage terminase large subunit-like protein
VERERLLGGNWKVRASAGKVFNRAWFRIVDAAPRMRRACATGTRRAREGAGKRTAGVRMADAADGMFYIEDVVTGQWRSGEREKVIRQIAELDGIAVAVWVEQEPGSGGKESAENTISNLAGYTIRADKVTGDKLTRAGPLSAQAEGGNVVLVRGAWNEAFLSEAQAYEQEAPFKDQIDAAAGAFNKLTAGRRPVIGAIRAGDTPGKRDPRVEAAEQRRAVREQQTAEFRALEKLVQQHGSIAVEQIRRLADPTFTLPEELRGR